MATLLLSDTVSGIYKETSEFINSPDLNKKDIRKKSFQELLQESFFHGASRFGGNFIA
ncbi:MAG TPA: hypothetical protein PLG15_03100 [Candidatus Gastranaerophilaceae bacterium]|nr:hypothetical protein [Candidatus Gastranaerophilaceae bacterium]HPT41352.1 hypothetical protein [Candidatus Gastranaerophilaceae bacterium]